MFLLKKNKLYWNSFNISLTDFAIKCVWNQTTTKKSSRLWNLKSKRLYCTVTVTPRAEILIKNLPKMSLSLNKCHYWPQICVSHIFLCGELPLNNSRKALPNFWGDETMKGCLNGRQGHGGTSDKKGLRASAVYLLIDAVSETSGLNFVCGVHYKGCTI